ncbi:hypothetical protein GCM10023238_08420 [Streptomyces heliomycini]
MGHASALGGGTAGLIGAVTTVGVVQKLTDAFYVVVTDEIDPLGIGQPPVHRITQFQIDSRL